MTVEQPLEEGARQRRRIDCPEGAMLLSQAAEHSWLPIGGAPRRGEGAT